jgi:hypothetical protein
VDTYRQGQIGSGRPGRPRDPAAGSPVAALEWMPLASLVLAADGSLIAVNRAWAALPGAAGAARGDGWLHAVQPLDREGLRARLRRAALAGEAGSADCRLAGLQGRRWSRWWWRPGPAGVLVVSVADIDDDVASEFGAWCGTAGGPVSRLVSPDRFAHLPSGHCGTVTRPADWSPSCTSAWMTSATPAARADAVPGRICCGQPARGCSAPQGPRRLPRPGREAMNWPSCTRASPTRPRPGQPPRG